MILSAIIYCPEPKIKLYHFLHSLLSTKSPRTIIQATINTIQSENILDNEAREGMKSLYLALDKVFNFQLGKIILATASFPQLENMFARGLPYLSPYSQEIQQCLSGASCQGVSHLIHTLGKMQCVKMRNCPQCHKC